MDEKANKKKSFVIFSNPSSLLRYLPGYRDIVFITIFAMVILLGPRLFNVDGDLGRHITIGNHIINQRAIPVRDIFSHTMNGEPLVPHEWLAEVVFALTFRILGLDGIVIMTALVISLSFTLLYIQLLLKGINHILGIFLTFLAFTASSIHFLARPHVFTFLFFIIWISLLQKVEYGQNPKDLTLPPLLMLVWANTHGAFISGFVVIGAMIIGAAWEWLRGEHSIAPFKRLVIVCGISFLFTFLNPAGVHLLETSLSYIQNAYLVSHTQEYLSPNFHDTGFLPFLFLLILMIFSFSLGRKRLRLSDSILAAGWTVMSLYSARNIPLFSIVITPYVAYAIQTATDEIPKLVHLKDRIDKRQPDLKGLYWSIVVLLTVVGLAVGNVFGSKNSFDPRRFPVQAMDWVEENPQPGNMYNYFTWGGYILFRGWPQYQVFIDGQTDFYGEELAREYEVVISGREGWDTILGKYDVRWVILPPSSPLSSKLNTSGWAIIYYDSTTQIFRKPD